MCPIGSSSISREASCISIYLLFITWLTNRVDCITSLSRGIIKFSEVSGAINSQKKSWRWLCVFFPDSLCAAVTSPSWAGCFTVWPAEGVSSGVTLHTADYCAEVTADTSRYIGLSSVTDQHQQQHNRHKLNSCVILTRVPEEDAEGESGQIHHSVELPQSRGGKQL